MPGVPRGRATNVSRTGVAVALPSVLSLRAPCTHTGTQGTSLLVLPSGSNLVLPIAGETGVGGESRGPAGGVRSSRDSPG